jgi:hypothetical protein
MGVELFEDSRLLYVLMVQLHFDTVGGDDEAFPLADVDNPTMTNANHGLYVIRQHANDERVSVIEHYRYFHRDSQHPADGLDLKRARGWTLPADQFTLDTIAVFCRELATHCTLCAPPQVYDFSRDPIDDALDAVLKLPFIHTWSAAPQ